MKLHLIEIQRGKFSLESNLFGGQSVSGVKVPPGLELVSKELNQFGVIAGLFWQVGCHSSRFVVFCSF